MKIEFASKLDKFRVWELLEHGIGCAASEFLGHEFGEDMAALHLEISNARILVLADSLPPASKNLLLCANEHGVPAGGDTAICVRALRKRDLLVGKAKQDEHGDWRIALSYPGIRVLHYLKGIKSWI